MVIQQILNNIDSALNECCDENCNDINIRKLMLALRQLETQLCDADQKECVKAPPHHKKFALQNCCFKPDPDYDACADKCRQSFFCNEFGNVLMLGLLIGTIVGVLVYIFNKSTCFQPSYCQPACC